MTWAPGEIWMDGGGVTALHVAVCDITTCLEASSVVELKQCSFCVRLMNFSN